MSILKLDIFLMSSNKMKLNASTIQQNDSI